MKLFKTLGIIFFAVIMFAISGCTTSFCSDTDVANIKTGLLQKLENGTGEGSYATPDSKALDTAGITIDSLKKDSVVVTGIEELDWETLGTLKYENGDSASSTYKTKYVDYLYNKVHPKACLVTSAHTDEASGAELEPKTFGFAFKQGLLEILAYPVSWGLVGIATITGGANGPTGWSLILGMFLVTFIIRAAMIAATWKSTKQSQALQLLQPQINAISAKYANKNDPQSKNQRSMEIMNLYKKNKVNPITSLISPFLTLPIFIAIYCAVKDTTVIYEGNILGISLGAKLGENVLALNWVAILTFIIMVGFQFVTMKLPQWIAKKKAPYKASQTKQPMNQQNMMTYFFLIMIVVVAWMLPIAMSIYWIASSAFSVFQTFLIQKLTAMSNAKKASARG